MIDIEISLVKVILCMDGSIGEVVIGRCLEPSQHLGGDRGTVVSVGREKVFEARVLSSVTVADAARYPLAAPRRAARVPPRKTA